MLRLMVYKYRLSIERRILDKILYVVHRLLYNTISVITVLVLANLWLVTGMYVLYIECSVKINFDAYVARVTDSVVKTVYKK